MRRIAQETINRVLEEVDIFDVISQYVDLKKKHAAMKKSDKAREPLKMLRIEFFPTKKLQS